ncbi:MAG: alpha-mannosidase, partial [Bacteroidetes bacterium]
MEMSEWPVFPTIQFGTFGEFFNTLEKIAEQLPIVDHELDFIFSGCYTTQTRIKLANRVSEAKMNESELFSTFSAEFVEGKYPYGSYEDAWKKILFNHFHDILPGSGVIETREFAMGQFQQVLAAANTGMSRALRNIAENVNTSTLPIQDEKLADTISEGAGVGFGLYDYGVPQTERGAGKSRIFHLFNSSAQDRIETVEITVWDWPGDMRRLEVLDKDGKPVKIQEVSGQMQQYHPAGDYWGHKYMKLAIDAEIPACGYSTYLLHEKEFLNTVVPHDEPRVEKQVHYILENNCIKVSFDSTNASILSLVDKKTGREMVDPKRPAGVFRLIDEDDSKGMTAWVIGRYMNVMNLDKDVKIGSVYMESDALRQWISYIVKFRNSKLSVMISLNQNSSGLDFNIDCDWQEIGEKGKSIPQLNFYMPLAYTCKSYKYDIPFGTITRAPMDMDVPAGSWALGMPESGEGSAVMLVSKTK